VAPLVIGLAVIALIALLLAIPLWITLSAGFHGSAIFSVRVRFLFGLLSWKTSSMRAAGDGSPATEAEKDVFHTLARVLEAAQVKGLAEKIRLLTMRVYRRVRILSLRSDLRVSLGDDYYTGMLAGLLIPANLYLNQMYGDLILVRPAFEEELFIEGDFYTDLQVRPIQVLVPCLGFAFSPEFRRARRIVAGGSCTEK